MSQKVLAIDDEQIVLSSIKRVLEAEGYAVDVCASGKEGRLLALDRAYDLVLTDIRMPGLGGMRILRDLKRVKPQLPVMIITGYATVASAVQAMKLGAAEYIEKPFTPDGLLSAVQGALSSMREEQPQDQAFLHPRDVISVLERAAREKDFTASLFYDGDGALDGYGLTSAEKLAILTGDVDWIERHTGTLTEEQKRWLEQRLDTELR